MGIRILLDRVFSHTGATSPLLQSVGALRVGAYQSIRPTTLGTISRTILTPIRAGGGDDPPERQKKLSLPMDFMIRRCGQRAVGCSGHKRLAARRHRRTAADLSQAIYREMKACDPDAVLIGEVREDASE